MAKVKINGEDREIAGFKAFKAIYATELVGEVGPIWREIIAHMAGFRAEFAKTNVVELDRVEALREARPRVVYRDVPLMQEGELVERDGTIVMTEEPVIENGQPVMTPGALAHVTEEAWAASGHKLRFAEEVDRKWEIADVVPFVMQRARVQVLRLLALVLATNAELEEWDRGDVEIDERLDERGRDLLYQADADELITLAKVSVEVLKDQLADPILALLEEVSEVTEAATSKTEEEGRPPAAAPMRVDETASSDGSPSSSGSSPSPGSDGHTENSPTGSPSAASSPSVPA